MTLPEILAHSDRARQHSNKLVRRSHELRCQCIALFDIRNNQVHASLLLQFRAQLLVHQIEKARKQRKALLQKIKKELYHGSA